MPNARQMAELTTQNVKLLPGKYATRGTKATPRSKKTPVIVHSTKRSKGSLRMTPAPEKAYSDQTDRMPAMTNVATVGYQLPAIAICAMCSPAPRKRYQGAPKKMQPRCSRAASAVKIPAAIRKRFGIVRMSVWLERDAGLLQLSGHELLPRPLR